MRDDLGRRAPDGRSEAVEVSDRTAGYVANDDHVFLEVGSDYLQVGSELLHVMAEDLEGGLGVGGNGLDEIGDGVP